MKKNDKPTTWENHEREIAELKKEQRATHVRLGFDPAPQLEKAQAIEEWAKRLPPSERAEIINNVAGMWDYFNPVSEVLRLVAREISGNE